MADRGTSFSPGGGGLVNYFLHLTALTLATAMAATQLVLSPVYRTASFTASALLPSWALPSALTDTARRDPGAEDDSSLDEDFMNWRVRGQEDDEEDESFLQDAPLPPGLEGSDAGLVRTVQLALRRVDRDPLPFKAERRFAAIPIALFRFSLGHCNDLIDASDEPLVHPPRPTDPATAPSPGREGLPSTSTSAPAPEDDRLEGRLKEITGALCEAAVAGTRALEASARAASLMRQGGIGVPSEGKGLERGRQAGLAAVYEVEERAADVQLDLMWVLRTLSEVSPRLALEACLAHLDSEHLPRDHPSRPVVQRLVYKIEEEEGLHDAERDLIESLEDLAEVSPREAMDVAMARARELEGNEDSVLRASLDNLIHRLQIFDDEEPPKEVAVNVLPSPMNRKHERLPEKEE